MYVELVVLRRYGVRCMNQTGFSTRRRFSFRPQLFDMPGQHLENYLARKIAALVFSSVARVANLSADPLWRNIHENHRAYVTAWDESAVCFRICKRPLLR